jgi:hypothetical protein
LAERVPDLVKATLELLVLRGILEVREKHVLWALRSRRYPVIDGHAQSEAKLRLMRVLFSDDLPTPHDSTLIGLSRAAGMLLSFLSRAEIGRLETRVDLIGGIDLVVKATEEAIRMDALERARALMLHP